ncbi:MAG: hypothetical protein KDB88_14470 [Flavobacteriales bacterium]|nr:hypothetical protein [Flavobacteriales bacterium]
METKLELDLIRGTYSASWALEILSTLLNDKITSHQRRLFAYEERGEHDASNSLQRIAELQADLARVRAFLAQAQREDVEITIESQVKAVKVNERRASKRA